MKGQIQCTKTVNELFQVLGGVYVYGTLEHKERVLIKDLKQKGFRVLVLEELPYQVLINYYLF